jgi:hypothetical protein
VITFLALRKNLNYAKPLILPYGVYCGLGWFSEACGHG